MNWTKPLTLEELNRSKIEPGSTIMPKDYIINEFYRALGTSEERINERSKERTNNLANGWFLGTWNETLCESRNVTTNFQIPNCYHINNIEEDYITIRFYSNMKQGYKEVPGLNVEKYHNMVNTIKLKYDDFYLMGHAH